MIEMQHELLSLRLQFVQFSAENVGIFSDVVLASSLEQVHFASSLGSPRERERERERALDQTCRPD